MRIVQLSLAGRGAWPDLDIERLNPQLNVFYGKPGAGKSTIAQLANHLLYGKSQSPWRQQFGQTVPLCEGRLVVESSGGSFVLRRHLDADRTSRLTVAALDGGTVDSRTVQTLLADLSPQVIAQLMAVDFAEAPSVDWLLSNDFSRELAKSAGKNLTGTSRCPVESNSGLDRRRIDELIRQRDAINESIEKQLAVRRQEGTVLTTELAGIEGQLQEQRRQLEGVQADLRMATGEIAQCETRLRYVSLEAIATKQVRGQNLEKQRQELTELEAEVTRCRQALGDLQAREAAVRAELAQVAPDGTANRASYLVDSRQTLCVLEKLIDDLDAEVSLLARAPGANAYGSPGSSHAQLSPVAAMLRQQVYTLCGLVTEQERAARRQHLLTESRQICRSQLDLGERLEHLLSRRELLIEELSSAAQPTLLRPQPPALDHCRCEQHAEFVSHADPLLVGYAPRHPQEAELRGHYETLLRRQNELQGQADSLAGQLAELECRWQDVQRERAGFVDNSIERQRFELERLEMAIREALKPAETRATTAAGTWRASDILAQLTDGQLVQIRLERDGRHPLVIDRKGQAFDLNSLSTAAHDQLYVALTLALVGAFARRGVHLPTMLDEPFLRQDAAGSAAMAGVLAEFARTGHQLLVFTEDLDALHRFESLNSTVFDLARLRRQRAPEPTQPPETTETTLTRLVRETADGHKTSVFQFPNGSVSAQPQYYLTEDSSLAEFPVLGSGTTEAFAKIGIVNVGQLLSSEAATVATQLNRQQVSADTVALWQSHMRLMCSVPGLTLNDAQVLTASGIRSFAELRTAVPIELETTIRDFLRSDRGQRFAGSAGRFNASLIREWIHLGTHHRQPTPSATRTAVKHGPQARAKLRAHRPPQEAPQFYLNRASHVANAPSISPQTAQSLASVGIRTVADLLNADAAAVAAKLGQSQITAEAIAQWQLQARLVCQIADLRGYGAQLLVACGFTSAEQIAGTRTADLIRKVQTICQSKQGERILRNHEAPTPAKIKRWALNAAHCRPLEAA